MIRTVMDMDFKVIFVNILNNHSMEKKLFKSGSTDELIASQRVTKVYNFLS